MTQFNYSQLEKAVTYRYIKKVQEKEPLAHLKVCGWIYTVIGPRGEHLSEGKASPRKAWQSAAEFLEVRGK